MHQDHHKQVSFILLFSASYGMVDKLIAVTED